MELHHTSDYFRIGSSGNIVCSHVLGHAHPDIPAIIKGVMESVCREATERVVIIAMVGTKADLPSAEQRKKFASLTDGLADQIALIIQLPLGTGFRASVIRSVMTGIQFLMRAKVENVVVATLEEAMGRAREHTSISEAQLRELVETIRT